MGARRHYAIPRMLNDAGRLGHFYTDICAVQGFPRLLEHIPSGWRSQSAAVQRLAGRVPKGVPLERISSFPVFGLVNNYRLSRARTKQSQLEVFTWAAKRFSGLIMAAGVGDADAVFTFDRAGLELMEQAKMRGIKTIMEQTVAPFETNQNVIGQEQDRYPLWEPSDTKNASVFEAFTAREKAEWSCADLILCGSNYVKEAIVECGGPGSRCLVVPYGVDFRLSSIERGLHDGPLRVLTVGSVGLRKGAPYILDAAKAIGPSVHFRMVGSLDLLPKAEAELRKYVDVIGPVPRSRIAEHYQWADVFLLPSLNEGSAEVVYEALSCGLPVICTPNTGSIVRSGVDGFIIPVRDVYSICTKLEQLKSSADLLKKMGDHARERASQFTVAEYGRRLVNAIESIDSDLAV